MKQRRMAPSRPLPIVVKGPDDDRGRTIDALMRENRRLKAMILSLEGLLKQINYMHDNY